MAMNTQAPKQTNFWLWGGATIAAIVLIAALGYGIDWSGGSAADAVSPTIEQTAPVSE
ncbi:hypothetical protein ROTO_34350 [Roseovarius tolerans]|uniref:Uncharacterized protein n=1 Tax=Roseovarius tolerans TaxID=74031 RepID=A0A0L6CR89_9RHOB|nr:hypothetical protein [Roseovarius tolerans]KNX40028.1 hypothetical protein ROTO_34350 [Roseovarius tolerans]